MSRRERGLRKGACPVPCSHRRRSSTSIEGPKVCGSAGRSKSVFLGRATRDRRRIIAPGEAGSGKFGEGQKGKITAGFPVCPLSWKNKLKRRARRRANVNKKCAEELMERKTACTQLV